MCEFSIINKRGMTQWMTCSKDNEFCPFQRVCHDTKSIINTPTYSVCPKLIEVTIIESEEKPIIVLEIDPIMEFEVAVEKIISKPKKDKEV